MTAKALSKKTGSRKTGKKILPLPRLPKFDASSWPAIAKAFSDTPALEMTQGWVKRPSRHLLRGTVRVGWRDNSLHVFAHLPDKDIYSLATSDNQNLWQLGDVFELFLRDTSRKTYYELHISPNGHWMQLELPDYATLRKTSNLDSLKIPRLILRFNIRLNHRANYWEVYAKVPAARICGKKTSLADRTWLASFSRYDCTRGRKEPVISSTSLHREPNFHRQQEWRLLHFA